LNALQTLVHRQPIDQRVADALALIPDCDGVRDCYFCAAADLARAADETRSAA
jgi:hypothetical protein